jgi:hypothetical protein
MNDGKFTDLRVGGTWYGQSTNDHTEQLHTENLKRSVMVDEYQVRKKKNIENW